MLLLDAMARCLAIRQEIGALAIVVHAKDQAARAFYRHHGFIPLADHEASLFIAMATLAKLGI